LTDSPISALSLSLVDVILITESMDAFSWFHYLSLVSI
jgi:hypothetical protein